MYMVLSKLERLVILKKITGKIRKKNLIAILYFIKFIFLMFSVIIYDFFNAYNTYNKNIHR